MKIHQNAHSFFVSMLMVLAAIMMTVPSWGADTYPSKPVTLSIPYPAGGATDVSARLLATSLEKIWKQPIIPVNKPGAATAISMEFVKRASPDGYTLGVMGSGGMMSAHMREVPFHFFNDFNHIALYCTFVLGIAVHADSPWKTLKDLVEYGQKNPGKLRFGSVIAGSPAHLMAEQFALINNFKWIHVPYESDAAQGTALQGKHVDAIMCAYQGWGAFVKAGTQRLLVVFSDERLKEFQEAPTAKELGYKYSGGYGYYGICGPRDLPEDIKQKIESAIKAGTEDPEFKKAMDKQCLPPRFMPSKELIPYFKEFDKEMVSVMKKVGIKIVRDVWE